jgi:hypothetical protein
MEYSIHILYTIFICKFQLMFKTFFQFSIKLIILINTKKIIKFTNKGLEKILFFLKSKI